MELGPSGITSAFPIFSRLALAFFDNAGADDDRPRFRENARGLQADTGVAAGYNCNLSPKVAAAKRFLAGRLRSESRGFCSVVIGLLLSLLMPSPWEGIPMARIFSGKKRYESSGDQKKQPKEEVLATRHVCPCRLTAAADELRGVVPDGLTAPSSMACAMLTTWARIASLTFSCG